MSKFVSVTKDEALAALRAGAWTETHDKVYEPAAIVDGEQLYRDVTPPARRIVHCFAGAFGADWDLESAESEVENADDVYWAWGLGHNLATRTGDRVLRFGVEAPVGVRAAWQAEVVANLGVEGIA